jgi:hypothetical protein
MCNGMLQVIRTGMKHRKVGSHRLNMESSRSHAIMTIYCDATPTGMVASSKQPAEILRSATVVLASIGCICLSAAEGFQVRMRLMSTTGSTVP